MVSVFSKTLVLLTGLAIVTVQVSGPFLYGITCARVLGSGPPRNRLSQVASRWGVDLLATLKIRQRMESSRVLSALNKNPTFKLAFGTTFALAAFMHF